MLSDEPPNRRFRLYQSFRRRRRTTASTTTATTTTTTTTTEPPVAVSPALLNDERQQIPESDRSREISFHDRPAVAVDNSVFEDILTDASSSVVAPALGVQHDEDEFNGIDDATLTDASAGANVTDFSEVRAAPVQILDGQMRLVGGRTENEVNQPFMSKLESWFPEVPTTSTRVILKSFTSASGAPCATTSGTRWRRRSPANRWASRELSDLRIARNSGTPGPKSG